MIRKGIQVLVNLEHRGACGCDPESGDGAGVLIQLPDALFRSELGKQSVELPEAGTYAVGMVFLDPNPEIATHQATVFQETVRAEGQSVLAWRDVPHHPEAVGRVAREGLPVIRQIFIGASDELAQDQDAFERKLYVIRRLVEESVAADGPGDFFYVPSLSSRTIAYVGMLISRQMDDFFPDLLNPLAESATPPTPSRPGGWPSRSASSPTTARSTPCAATATGCTPAKV